MADDSKATGETKAESETGQKPGTTFSNSALVALLSSLLAIVVPVTTFIVKHYEKESDLALKDKELEQTITLECLKLAVSKDTAASDRPRVLQAIVTFDTPLKQWALNGVAALDRESDAEQKQTQAVQASFDKRSTAPTALLVLKNKELILQQRIFRENQNGDSNAVDADLEALLIVKSREGRFKAVPVRTPAITPIYPVTNQAALATSRFKPIPIRESDVTVEIVSTMFPVTPTASIRENLPLVLSALKQFGILDRTMVLIALSTIRAGQESFSPMAESISRLNTSPDGQPFNLYDNRRDLGNLGPPDGARFKGRGFIDLTGRANYTRLSADLGLGTFLVDSPDKACDPKIAAQLLAFSLERQEIPLKEAASHRDLVTMRKLVNGGSTSLDRFVDAYRTGDKLLPK